MTNSVDVLVWPGEKKKNELRKKNKKERQESSMIWILIVFFTSSNYNIQPSEAINLVMNIRGQVFKCEGGDMRKCWTVSKQLTQFL